MNHLHGCDTNHLHGCQDDDDFEQNMIYAIHHHRNDRHFAEFLFEIFLYELAASIPASKPSMQVRLDLISLSAKTASDIIKEYDYEHNANTKNKPLVYDMWIATAPWAPTHIDLYNYLRDPWRPTRLFKRDISIDTTQTKISKIPTVLTLPALTKEDHDHFQKTYAKIEPEFQQRFAVAVSHCRVDPWYHNGSGGRDVEINEEYWGVEKYTKAYNIKLRKQWADEAAAALTAEEASSSPSTSVPSSAEDLSGTMSKAAAKKAKKKAKKANEKADENNDDSGGEGQVTVQPVFGEAYKTALRLRDRFAVEMKQAQTGKRREDYDHDELMRLSLGWFKQHMVVVGTNMAVFNANESVRRERLEEARQHAVGAYEDRLRNIQEFSQQFNSSQVAIRVSLERFLRNTRKKVSTKIFQKASNPATTVKAKSTPATTIKTKSTPAPVAQPTLALNQFLDDYKIAKATPVQTTPAKPTAVKPVSVKSTSVPKSSAPPTLTPVPTTPLPQRTSTQIKKCEDRVRELDLFLDKYTDLLASKRLVASFPGRSRIIVMAGYKSDARKKILQKWTPSLRIRGNIDRFLDSQIKGNHITPHEAYRLSISLEDAMVEKARRVPMGGSAVVRALINSSAGDWPTELPEDLFSLDSDTDKASTVAFDFKVSYDSYYGGIYSDDGSVPDAEWETDAGSDSDYEWETDNGSVPDAEDQTDDEEDIPVEILPEKAITAPTSAATSAASRELGSGRTSPSSSSVPEGEPLVDGSQSRSRSPSISPEEDFAAEQDRTMEIREPAESFAERSKLMEQDEFSMASLHFFAEDDASEYLSTGSLIGSDHESTDDSDSEFEGGIDEQAGDMNAFAGVPVATKMGYLVDSRRTQAQREWLETVSQRQSTAHSRSSESLHPSLDELYDSSDNDDEDDDYQYESEDSEGSLSDNTQDDGESDMETEISEKEIKDVLTYSKPGLYDDEMLAYLELCHQEFLQTQWTEYTKLRNQAPDSTVKTVKENQRLLLDRTIGLEKAVEEEQRLEREREVRRLREELAKRAEEAERARLAVEAFQAKKKAAVEQVRKKAAAEEEAKKKAAAEEEARKKAAAEEEARKKAAAEEEARKKAAAEEEARKKAAAEEEARKKAAAEKEARKKAAAQEEAKKKAAAEEEDRRRSIAEEEDQRARIRAATAAAFAQSLAKEAAQAAAEELSTKMVKEEAAAQATAILAGAGLGIKRTPEPKSDALNVSMQGQDEGQESTGAATKAEGDQDSTTRIDQIAAASPSSSQLDPGPNHDQFVPKAEAMSPQIAGNTDIADAQERLRVSAQKLKEAKDALEKMALLKKERQRVEAERLALEASLIQGEPMMVLNDRTLYYDWRGINLSLSLWRSPQDHFSTFELWVDHWYSQLRPNVDSNKLREGLLIRLQDIFDQEFPGKELILRPFGSYITGLGNTWSDIDICIFSFSPELLEPYADVSNLAWMLGQYGMENIVAITDAKVPIVKFVDPDTKIACDMNVQKPLGIYNSELIKAYLDIDPRLGKFLYLLKYFAKAHGILDGSTGFLCSYAFILMAIVFFQEQEQPILPRLQVRQERPMSPDDLKRLRKGGSILTHRNHPGRGKASAIPATFMHALREGTVLTEYVEQDGKMFDVTFDNRMALYRKHKIGSLNQKSVSQLLFEFFQYFSRQFDYRTMEVSSKHGKFQERHAIDKEKKLQMGQQLTTGIPSTTSSTLAPGTKGQYVFDQPRQAWLSGDELAYFRDLEANGGQPSGRVPAPGFFRPTNKSDEEVALASTDSPKNVGDTTGGQSPDGGPITDDSFLCVMDPFIYNRNVAGTCRGERLGKVWRCFDHAYKCFALGKFAEAFQPLKSGE